MGKSSSKINVGSKLPSEVVCPLCDEEFTRNSTFNELNRHLHVCGNLHKSKLILRTDITTNDDFQLVIDYNNTILQKSHENPNSNLKSDIITKFQELCNATMQIRERKKLNSSVTVKADSVEGICQKLKEIDLFNKILIEYENKTIDINTAINLYFDTMIKKNLFYIVNGKTIGINFGEMVDWELFGVILSLILINIEDISLKFKISTLICKIIVKERVILNDLQYCDQELYEAINKIKNCDLDENDIRYVVEKDELVVGGKDMRVTEATIDDYIEKRVNYEMKKFKDQISKIRKYIFSTIPESTLSKFNGDDLYQIINKMI